MRGWTQPEPIHSCIPAITSQVPRIPGRHQQGLTEPPGAGWLNARAFPNHSAVSRKGWEQKLSELIPLGA